jgi:uncharacterized protein (TIGR02594 family)
MQSILKTICETLYILFKGYYRGRAGKLPVKSRDRDKYTMKNIEKIKEILPAHYHWLIKSDNPKVLQEALSLYGTYEFKGAENNPVILEWSQEIGVKVGIDYNADSIPWCGLFAAICVKRAGFEVPSIAVRAKAWLNFGTKIPKHEASRGDVLIFDRKGGGHVGFYVGHDNECYHVLGGNQSDQVNITRIRRDRLEGVRRCPWKVAQPKSVKPIKLVAQGKISENEA